MKQGYIASTSGIQTRDKIGYAMGDFGSCLLFGLVQSVLQRYYTDILQIGIVDIMLMMVIARVWDAVNDPIWGRIIDRTAPARDGRYRRWIKYFAIPVAVSGVLMFVKIPGLTQGQYLAYAYVTYILFGMLYTCINIPYGSLAQVVTSNDKERSTLSVFRSIGSTFGALPAMALLSFYAVVGQGDERRMVYSNTLTGVVAIAVLAVIAFFLCYRWNKERVDSKPMPREKGQTWKVIKQLFKSRPFVAVCLASMLFLAAQMFQTGYYSYLFDYYFKSKMFLASQACIYLPVAVIMFFAGKLGNRFGRRDVCAYGILFASVVNFVLFLLHTHNVYVYLFFCLLTGIGTAFIFLLVWVLASDAIDYNEVKHGIHDEATSYSFYSFMRKLGQTVAAVLINSVLLNIGYTDNVLNIKTMDEAAQQPILDHMYNSSALIPAVLFLLVFLLLRFVYPLSKQKIDELQVEKERVLGQA
ncbi:MAG: MFS transporter [Oscillospiraceae bacterium]|nr:MFS transporter [Oscillospiraceae bacterium]